MLPMMAVTMKLSFSHRLWGCRDPNPLVFLASLSMSP